MKAPEIIILSEKDTIQRVNEYIETNSIESDDNYIYLYKSTDNDLVDLDDITTKYELNSIHTTEYDKNIEDEFGKGIKVRTLNEAIDKGKSSSYVGYAYGVLPNKFCERSFSIPINPLTLFQYNYRILKVKIKKSDLIIPSNKLAILRTGRIEIVEEITIVPKFKYETRSITEIDKCSQKGYTFTINIINETNDESITINFNSDNIGLSQNSIMNKIKDRLKEMQLIFDEYESSKGNLKLYRTDLI
jgi:K+/H+ antiporter YhaU regulatory subunit KhtT